MIRAKPTSSLVTVAAAAVALNSCAINYYYTPGVYEIEKDRIAPFASAGTVDVISIQEPDPDRKFVFFAQGPTVWNTDRAQVAQALAGQLAGELRSRGARVQSPADRTMRIAVPFLSATPATWVMVGSLTVEVTLDDRPALKFQVTNKSPGNIWRTMNGGIAIAVIEILNDPGVREWLEQPRPDAETPPLDEGLPTAAQ